jgi:hypothetical protein
MEKREFIFRRSESRRENSAPEDFLNTKKH